MSGPVAQYGDQEFTGAEQAVADINAKGGIKGEKLQIVKYDDACDPKQAVAVANKVVNDGSNTSSVTCVLPLRSLRLTSTKTKDFDDHPGGDRNVDRTRLQKLTLHRSGF